MKPILTSLIAVACFAQMPDGPGREVTQKVCSQCHEIERAISLRQDRAGWQDTVAKMAGLGMNAKDSDLAQVVDYLSAHYPAEALPKLNVNKATAIELESGLSLRRSQSAAFIEYRKEHGPFKTLDDLKKVPGIDAAKIDSHKDRIAF
ncbi:MAG: helix-hairpin-helix domain-containing protein [Acidobacteriota bacterium]|nr:helix-hairpin-helix domain-containing protein [Acidobacteriota bacterium]